VLQCNEEKGKEKRGRKKLSFKLISQDERFHARQRTVPVSRAPCM